MTPVQGQPPKLDFRLPKRLKHFLMALRQFAIEIQPINGPGIKMDQFPQGRLLTGTGGEINADELIYYVQNGELKAGYFYVVDEPNAPGL